jgi:hypothetical protein
MPDDQDDFFVGYLPTPPRLRRRLRVTAAVLLLLAVAIAGAVAARQRDPGTGKWDPYDTRTFEGTLRMTPYPFLEVAGAAGRTRGMLVIDQGKVGGGRCLPIGGDGARVQIRGQLLERDSLTLIELADEPEPVKIVAAGNAAMEPLVFGAALALDGEVIDPKCYAGAMKPGQGKTHKACAALCLRGGIPPVFITGSGGGPFVLVDAEGGPLRGAVLARAIDTVGEGVRVTGTPVDGPGIRYLRVDAGRIMRR